jgi:glycerol-3-phosphate cytidylyltransferase-like family protein
MSTIVIIPGGFHPFHAGHYALYKSALEAFPNADVYVAATNDQSERPFPFALKEKLAKLAGVAPGRFVQVKSPFEASEITSKYDPDNTVLIYVKSEKNAKNGSDPEGPFPAEIDPSTGKLPVVTRGPRKGQPVSTRLQYYKGNEDNLQPMSKHSYLAYLPTVEFGPGITSATQIRKAWPTLNDKRKLALVMSLYPAAQKNPKLAQNVVGMFDQVMGSHVDESFGSNYPETYEQENKPFQHKGGYRITDITSEDVNEEHVHTAPTMGGYRWYKPRHVPSQVELNADSDNPIDENKKKDDEPGDAFIQDPETTRMLNYVMQHYPEAGSKQQAFMKYVLHAIKHSEEDDNMLNKKVELLSNEIERLKANQGQVAQVTENFDYLDEN